MTGSFGTTGAPLEPERPPSNVAGSILVTVFCCAPFGIVAIIYGVLVHSRWKAGDVDGAKSASNMSEKWMYGGIGAAILMFIVALIWRLFLRITTGRF